jgi:urea transport system permease protein
MVAATTRAAPERPWPARLAASAVLLFLLLFPLFAGDYEVGLLGKFLVFGIFALSLDLIWG